MPVQLGEKLTEQELEVFTKASSVFSDSLVGIAGIINNDNAKSILSTTRGAFSSVSTAYQDLHTACEALECTESKIGGGREIQEKTMPGNGDPSVSATV